MNLVFMGTPQAAVPTLELLITHGHKIGAVYTQPDRPSGRGQKLAASPVKQLAASNGIEVRQPLKIKTDEAFEEFRSLDADAAIVVAYGRILPDRWLSAFPQGAINVHFSLLPKYRGAAPVSWAVANGETETGVTTMQMDAGLDTGDVLLQRATQIGAEENSIYLMERLAGMGAELLAETLSSLDTITPMPQDDSAATFAPILKKEYGAIDWSLPASEIANRVRGFQPFPTSFTFVHGSRLTIWGASAVEGAGKSREIVIAHGDELAIATGHGILRVVELQPEGKRRMNVRDYLNGANLKVGTVLG
ncbi:MAG: methionyl-tRNA formyltransferase [Pyrinomonadaceae bacterium]